MPTTKTFDIHTTPMRHALYLAITQTPSEVMYLQDGTKLVDGLSSVTMESYKAHGSRACNTIAQCAERRKGVHPDTRQAQIASATLSNVYVALSEYKILMRHLGLDWRT